MEMTLIIFSPLCHSKPTSFPFSVAHRKRHFECLTDHFYGAFVIFEHKSFIEWKKGSSAKHGNYSFSHPCVIQNLLDLLSSVEHRNTLFKRTLLWCLYDFFAAWKPWKPFVFHWRKETKSVWDDMNVSKWRQNWLFYTKLIPLICGSV